MQIGLPHRLKFPGPDTRHEWAFLPPRSAKVLNGPIRAIQSGVLGPASFLLTQRNLPKVEAIDFLAATVEHKPPKGQQSVG